jgi:pantoate--beta-alanine ligase
MHIFTEIAPLRTHLNTLRSPSFSVGFVPTMGALHEGHLSLIRASRNQNTVTVCSIYVNPTQFGNADDLAKYPRTLDKDISLLKGEKCDIVFSPDNREMYGTSAPMNISFPNLDNVLEGAFRPGHFSGVAQVVAKLFNIVQPDNAYFGEKDFQQVMVVSRLVEGLKFHVNIVSIPIVREPDGLAMSSRNQRLSAAERQSATVLYACLQQTREGLLAGKSLQSLMAEARSMCASQGVNLEYLAVADRKEFRLLDIVSDPQRAVILIAAQVGPVRLIDNLFIQP